MGLTRLKKIGSGGFADVYEAFDEDLDREIAVKIFRSRGAGDSDAIAHAKALAKINHENVVTVHRMGEVSDPETGETCPCVVMELIEGETLAESLKANTVFSREDVARIGHGLIEGLQCIHGAKLDHGDLHDENILLTEDEVKIIDILYRNYPTEISTASHEKKARNDVRDLQEILEEILLKSDFGQSGRDGFRQGCSTRANLDEIRRVFSSVAGGFALVPPVENENGQVTEESFSNSAIYFYNERLLPAFPGVRGVVHFNDPAVIIDRLKILLRKPLLFYFEKEHPEWGGGDTIWWFRGFRNMLIDRFDVLSSKEILLNSAELSIKKAAVYHGTYYRSFIYIECDPMEPTGLYSYDEGRKVKSDLGFASEEYGLFNGQKITRGEHDDGAAVVDGRVVDTQGYSELRNRYLTPYNFVIAGKLSSINHREADRGSCEMFNEILEGTRSVRDLADFYETIPKRF